MSSTSQLLHLKHSLFNFHVSWQWGLVENKPNHVNSSWHGVEKTGLMRFVSETKGCGFTRGTAPQYQIGPPQTYSQTDTALQCFLLQFSCWRVYSTLWPSQPTTANINQRITWVWLTFIGTETTSESDIDARAHTEGQTPRACYVGADLCWLLNQMSLTHKFNNCKVTVTMIEEWLLIIFLL